MKSFRFVLLGLQFFSLYQVSFSPGPMKRYSEHLYNLTLSHCALATKSFLRNSEVWGGGTHNPVFATFPADTAFSPHISHIPEKLDAATFP